MFWKKKTPDLSILSNTPSGGFSKYVIGILIILFCILIGFGIWGYTWSQKYNERVAPNVFIGSIDVSGKTMSDVRILLQKKSDDLLAQGISVRLNGETKMLPLSTLIDSDSVEDVTIDIDQTAQSIFSVHQDTNSFIHAGKLFIGLFEPTSVPIRFTTQNEAITESLHTLFSSSEKPATDTSFVISPSSTGWDIHATEGVAGTEVETKNFLSTLNEQLRWLKSDTIELALVAKSPTINASQAETEIPLIQNILKTAPYPITHKEDDGTIATWPLTAQKLSAMLIPLPDGSVGMQKESFDAFIKPITMAVNHLSKNARFQITGNRVTEFVQSEDGRSVDEERLFEDTLHTIQTQSTEPIQLVTRVEKTSVTTASVNDLGITDKLGVGFSSYKGSPKNRIKNIQNGVNLLNGLLIAPGDTFSLIQALRPFTKENGYLSELVIKGDKIEPELGGGLCQIGTTTFRATMNSGLPVIERSNHSLAVSYYNDPSNHNPGTDATIYEPAPDFKFTNDTGHYILIGAENLTDKQQLRFTFWGTTDGRKGSYTPPIVLRRIPVGEKITTETTNLKPGVEKCQEAHIGADASFTYSIEHTDGTIVKRVFNSHYRPLPKICLIGTDPTKIKSVEPQEITTTPTTNATPN